MKNISIGIHTINDNENFGNRLQNYAVHKLLEDYGEVENAVRRFPNELAKFKYILWKLSKHSIEKVFVNKNYRTFYFQEFNQRMQYASRKKVYDINIYGSDQIWNPFFSLTSFINPTTLVENNVVLCASISISNIPKKYEDLFKVGLKKFKAISVREYRAAEIVEEYAGNRPTVLVDPTLCVDASVWRGIETHPRWLENDNYLLLYFLGNLSEMRKQGIEKFCKSKDIRLINLSERSIYNVTSPTDYIYLINHANYVVTDSFHGSVFSIIFKKKLMIYSREDELMQMNTRIDTLLNKMQLRMKNCKLVNEDSFIDDYSNTDSIIMLEKENLHNYLKSHLRTSI